MKQALAWLVRFGIGRRIALAMVLSLVVVQAQIFLQLMLFASFEVRMTGTRWLADTAAAAARAAFAAPVGKRPAILEELGRGLPAELLWSRTRPTWPGDAHSPVTARLEATIRETLGSDAGAIEITLSPVEYAIPVRVLQVGVVPGDVASHLGTDALRAGEPETLLPASVRVAVQGRDGSWVGVAPVSFVNSGFITKTPLVPIAAGGLIVALLSMLTARRIMAPLNRLVIAANRIGASREVVPVMDERLGEFAPVARAFDDMQRRLFRLVDDRTQMLAAISHDLRSALTRLRIAAEACRGEAERNAIVSELDDMQSMVESTLAFASGEARMTPNRTTDLAALLISLVDEAADSGRAVSYSGPDHAELMAHPVALKRAFNNLIDNAVKYGGAARLDLQVDDAPSKLRRLMIRIEDDGPGIPPGLVEDAFAPFRRLDPSRSNEVPGVGLGLTIARDVVRSHGGTITLRGAARGGLSVEIELPAVDDWDAVAVRS